MQEKKTENAASDVKANREEKRRAVNKIRNILPSTPEKRAAIIEELCNSLTIRPILEGRGLLNTVNAQHDIQVGRAVIADASSAVSAIKNQRSRDTTTALKVGLSFLCGENVSSSRLKTAVAKRLDINRRRLAQVTQHLRSVLSQNLRWLDVSRKTRSDAISANTKKLAYEFWASPDISRPTGNKKDIVRERVAAKTYMTHEKQLLDKSQTEVYLEFKSKYPEIKIGQRTFEKCKPFFVKPAREEDRVSCCCRTHVEARMLFTQCMNFRKSVVAKMELSKGQNDQPQYPVFSHLTDIVQQTLCPKQEGKCYNEKDCLYRECPHCGVVNFETYHQEEDQSVNAPLVKWEKFEYVVCGKDTNGKDKKRLRIVSKETSPGEMFKYFKSLLQGFPAHQFRASWQHQQFKELMGKLPLHHACCIHDYSENYSCRYQKEVQSLYFSQNQVSIHVTILYRHACAAKDGTESTEDEPVITTEHLFVISPDVKHDHHSVHSCRQLLAEHLKKCGDITVLHEWTDGCSAQYKSRHCMADVTFSETDFGFTTIRNYMETSHAKGPQDDAGANVKHMCDLDVIRGKVRIQTAKDFYEHLEANFKHPAAPSFPSRSVKLAKREFFYLENTDRNRGGRSFKEVKGNRDIHSVRAGEQPGSLCVRHLSCYCDNCLDGNYQRCSNKDYVDNWTAVDAQLETLPERRITRSETTEDREDLKSLVFKNSTIAIAAADRGEDYYLLKVTGEGEEVLQKSEKDGCNCKYRRGSNIFRGNFYNRLSENALYFALDTTKQALVFSETVRYICSPLQEFYDEKEDLNILQISDQEHLDILDCLNPIWINHINSLYKVITTL